MGIVQLENCGKKKELVNIKEKKNSMGVKAKKLNIW